ncbi:lipase family protein [Labilithrix luteola]|nr:alpha/beta fold hydrolase [Labilithrix luteola]
MKPTTSLALALAGALGSVLFACGSDGGPSGGASPDVAPSPSTTTTTTGPGNSTPPDAGPPSPKPDAGDDAGTDDNRARCGATPYTWLPSTTMGDVLQAETKAQHTIIELNYALYKASSALKTTRLAKLGTKSKLLRYQTQDRGKPIDATALVSYPDVSGNKTYPIMLILHGTAGFNDACAPSKGVADDTFGGFLDEAAALMAVFASFGYITVAPDYIGLKSLGAPTGFMHPYLVAEPTAIASLDAVRAAKKALVGSNVTPGDVVVMGGSQGGHAAAFVNRYAPHYAPELTIKGSVWDVPPTDLLNEAQVALGSWVNSTKNMVAVTAAFDSWYASAPGRLGSAFLAPYDTSVPAALASTCSSSQVLSGATRETLFAPSYLAAGQKPNFDNLTPWACYFTENSLPTTSVPKVDSIPSMFLLAANDELVSTPTERAAFQKLCSQGHVLQYLECEGAGHTKPLTYAFDQWLDFLEARLAGTPLTDVCNVKPAERCTSTPN